MITRKYEIARAIDKLKSVVQKNDTHPALSGILVNDGKLISTNNEITIHIRFDDSKGERFIIPMNAFDLIKNLPEGDVQITTSKENEITIKTDKIKNKYKSFPADNFMFQDEPIDSENGIKISGEKLVTSFGHVMYAAADKSANKVLTGICMDAKGDTLNIVALDGHMLAWDKIKMSAANDMNIIVPKTAAKKLVDMGMSDDVTLSYDKNYVKFKTDEYIIYSRLIDGKFFPYENMFKDYAIYTIVNKKELTESMVRAKLCVGTEAPAILNLDQDELRICISDKGIDYEEKINIEQVEQSLRIGFSSQYVLATIKAFTCENITLNFNTDAMPMVVEAEDSDMKALILPVKIR